MLAAAAVAMWGAGCGDEEADQDGIGKPPAGLTDITITLDADGPDGEVPRRASVMCEPSDGTSHPACSLIDELPPDPTAPTPPQTACTEIYGGPDEATVEGTLRGERVAATLTRENGCEIERFDRFTPLLRELFLGYRPGASLRP